MWRYLSNVPEPKAKKRTHEEDIEARRSYDKEKRKRSFQTSWLSKYSWLRYDSELQKMHCHVCREVGGAVGDGGTLVVGSSNFKLESVKAHDDSLSHKTNASKMKARSEEPGSSEAAKSLRQLSAANFVKMTKLFINAHGLAKKERPYTDFSFLCELDGKKGLDLGNTYINSKAAANFVFYIAETERLKLSEILKRSDFISIISDGSTDSSKREAEILFVRTCKDGVLKTFFAGLRNVGKADAHGITECLWSILTDTFDDTWQDKLIGMATDGAPVMIGSKGGVVKLFKDRLKRPHIQAVHCSAHRLELVFKDATKKIGRWKTVSNLLLGLYLFYRNSSLNRSNLLETFKALDDVKGLIPSRVGGTRWLGHTSRALKNVLTSYDAILEHLTQIQTTNSDAAMKGKNFMKHLRNKSTLTFMFFLWDVVICLSEVSAAFQRRDVTIGDIYVEVEIARKTLTRYQTSDGPKLQSMFKDQSNLTGNLDAFESARSKLLKGLLDRFDNRFEMDARLASSASAVVNKSLWPQSLSEDTEFGEDEVSHLAELFEDSLKSAGLEDTTNLTSEWLKLKELAYARCKDHPSNFSWPTLFRMAKGTATCEGILTLVDLLLSLPASSVDAERGFSVMKQIKTDWRSKLTDLHVSDLMTVFLESAPISSFDPAPAVNLWSERAVRSRRPAMFDDSESHLTFDQHVTESLDKVEQDCYNELSVSLSVSSEQ